MLQRFTTALSAVLFLALCLAGGTAHATSSEAFDLASLSGKVVYVDFWASWCVPCRQSFPWMNELQREFAKDGLVVIGVNVDHDRADAEAFIRRLTPTFRVSFDPDGALAEQFHVKGMPTSILIDRSGKVLAQHIGFRPEDRDSLREQIRALLAAH
jgi:thiol-disulfide isomerase/thioredoxin